MLSVLSETQRAIVETMTMRLHIIQALDYLKDAGHEMSRAKYFRLRNKVEEMKIDRMHAIAKYFPDQHLERIDRCELVEKLMWENYHQCKDQAKRVKILESIINIQPYLSGYYEATKMVLESTVRQQDNQQEQEPIVDYVPMIGDEEPIVGYDNEPWTLDSKPKPKLIAEEKPKTETTIVSAAPAPEINKQESEDGGGWKLFKCPTCQKSFYNNFTLSVHACYPNPNTSPIV
jgi:hypothetical protein